MKTMYPAQVNSPGTELAGAIDAAQDTIQVADGSVLPDGPNLLTIGTDEAAETILYTGKTGDELTGVTRGFQGAAQSWAAGTKVARYFTAYDHDAAVSNISELSTGLKALGDAARDRLDIVERQDVVLNAGLQILNAQRRAAFSLRGIRGRTLVNLLGRASYVSANDSSIVTFNVAYNANYTNTQTINVDIKNTNEGYIVYKQVSNSSLATTAGKSYVILADIKINSISGNGDIKLGGTNVGAYTVDKTKIGVWQKVSHRFTVTSDTFFSIIAGTCYAGGVFATTNFDIRNVSFYEIAQSDYDSLRTLSETQLAIKYPYVDSVQPVRNPYAIRYGENLLPPFYEWSIFNDLDAVTSRVLNGPYDTTLILAAASTNYIYLESPVLKVAAGSYQFNVEISSSISGSGKGAYIQLLYFDAYGERLGDTTKYTITSGNQGISTSIPQGTTTIKAVLGVDVGTTGTVTFKNPILNTGSIPKPFKPREDSMLALQTDLFADPLTGANADEVFEKDGQYFKLAKWKKVVLDDSISGLGTTGFTGFKVAVMNMIGGAPSSDMVTKYDGKVLSKKTNAFTTGDMAALESDSKLRISIFNTDSGWGDNYTPTADEIKAYFMGWKMYDGDRGLYTGTGTKYWIAINDWGMGSSTKTTTLPTVQAPISGSMVWTQPYQLVYQLAAPSVEPIVSEGMLTFNEGDNQIEIGTGLVARESVKPKQHANTNWIINNTGVGTSLSNKVSTIKTIYRDSRHDYEWIKETVAGAWGTEQAYLTDVNYDKSAAYSVTYLMLDKSPIVPFSGSYAANEKAMLQELTDAVQQNATAVSVLMNKKVDKDSLAAWITPTLINGWTAFNAVVNTAKFFKDSQGMVHFQGMVSSGAGGQPIFMLPVGFRPSRTREAMSIGVVNGSVVTPNIEVNPDGKVVPFGVSAPMWISLDSIVPFPAEL